MQNEAEERERDPAVKEAMKAATDAMQVRGSAGFRLG
jgi:hypothetical protein